MRFQIPFHSNAIIQTGLTSVFVLLILNLHEGLAKLTDVNIRLWREEKSTTELDDGLISWKWLTFMEWRSMWSSNAFQISTFDPDIFEWKGCVKRMRKVFATLQYVFEILPIFLISDQFTVWEQKSNSMIKHRIVFKSSNVEHSNEFGSAQKFVLRKNSWFSTWKSCHSEIGFRSIWMKRDCSCFSSIRIWWIETLKAFEIWCRFECFILNEPQIGKGKQWSERSVISSNSQYLNANEPIKLALFVSYHGFCWLIRMMFYRFANIFSWKKLFLSLSMLFSFFLYRNP